MDHVDERSDQPARPPVALCWAHDDRTVWRADRHGVVLLVSRSLFGDWEPEVVWPGGVRLRGPGCTTKTAAQSWCAHMVGVWS